MEHPISFFFVIYHYFCSLKSKILLPNDKKIAIENFCEMVEKLKEIRIEDYTYDLPDERIAKFPLENREASKLLIYDEGRIDERHFYEVLKFLTLM